MAVLAIFSKIYVAGGCKSQDCDSSNWMEVFDPETETWELVSSPLADYYGITIRKSAVVDGEITMLGNRVVRLGYKPNEDKWQVLGSSHYLDLGRCMTSPCVIDNLLYRIHMCKRIIWYNSEKRYWKKVKGLPKFDFHSLAEVVNYGGKMVVLSNDKESKKFWCAVISLERRNNAIQEIWGNVDWLDDVLTVPPSCGFFRAVAVTI